MLFVCLAPTNGSRASQKPYAIKATHTPLPTASAQVCEYASPGGVPTPLLLSPSSSDAAGPCSLLARRRPIYAVIFHSLCIIRCFQRLLKTDIRVHSTIQAAVEAPTPHLPPKKVLVGTVVRKYFRNNETQPPHCYQVYSRCNRYGPHLYTLCCGRRHIIWHRHHTS